MQFAHETSEPDFIAKLTLAIANAGASFTPSPTIATTFLADVMFQHRPLCHVDYNYPVRFSHQLAEQHNQRQIADRHSLSPHQYYVDVNAESLANYPLLDCQLSANAPIGLLSTDTATILAICQI